MTLEEFDELAASLLSAQKAVSLAAQELVYSAHEDMGTLFKSKDAIQELCDFALETDRITLTAIQTIRALRATYKPMPEPNQIERFIRLVKRSFNV